MRRFINHPFYAEMISLALVCFTVVLGISLAIALFSGLTFWLPEPFNIKFPIHSLLYSFLGVVFSLILTFTVPLTTEEVECNNTVNWGRDGF